MQARHKLLDILQAVPDARGAPLVPRLVANSGIDVPVVGRVADAEPLCRSEEALALRDPELILRGLGALSLAVGSRRIFLAVREDYHALLQVLPRLARTMRVEIVPVPARYPLDEGALLGLLAQAAHVAPEAMQTPHVYDGVVLADAGCAAAGKRVLTRPVTVAGAVTRPGVYELPLGAVLEDVVRLAGGSLSPAWVALEGGTMPRRLLDLEASVDLHSRLLIVLPNGHPQAVAARAPLGETIRRGAAACTSCAICSSVCPATGCHPHAVMREIKVGFGGEPRLPAPSSGVEACRECGLCSLACPAGLDPAQVCHALLSRLRQGGSATEARKTKIGGGWPMAAVEPRFGRGPLDAQVRASRVERLTIPLRGASGGSREALVGLGDEFNRGALLARGSGLVNLYAPLAGHVHAVDDDLGLVLRCG